MRRLAPAVGLFLLAPLVAEYLLGNLPITFLVGLPALAPMYGGGALLVREVARRGGRGWPTILLLALAYGVLEEGIATQSLFNPNYVGQHLLSYGYISALGIAGPWTVFVLTLHTVWSISVPIALVEAVTPSRRTTPWLGRVGLAVTAGLFAVGVVVTVAISLAQDSFLASVPQFAVTVVVILALVVGALRLRPGLATGPARAKRGTAPHPFVVGVVTMVAGAAFFLGKNAGETVPAALMVVAYLLLYAVAVLVVRRWSTLAGWGEDHRVALAGGALLTYAWHAFPEGSLGRGNDAVDLIGNAVFAAAAAALVIVAFRRARSGSGTPSPVPVGEGRSL